MQFLVFVINAVLNVVLLFIAVTTVLSHDDEAAVNTWQFCMWSSAALLVANLMFCIARMIVLWRRGKKEQSLWGLVVLALLPVSGYYLWGAYLLALLPAAHGVGGD